MRKALIALVALLVIVPAAGAYWFYKENFARVQGEFFDSDGVPIHYTVQGSGEPVILVHGFGFNADLNWRSPGFVNALAKRYQVIALDNRGHGLSGKPHEVEAYGENMPKDIINLMDHLGLEKAHVVGYSMGGFITMKLLTLYPERLLSAAPCGMSWDLLRDDHRETIDKIATALEQGLGFGPLLERLNINPNRRGLVERIFNRFLNRLNDTQALAKAMRGMEQLEVPEALIRDNQVPTLTVVGDIDPLAETAEKQHEVMKNHELVYLKGADHVSAMRHPDFIPALLKFLEAHPAGSWTYAAPREHQPEAPQTPEESTELDAVPGEGAQPEPEQSEAPLSDAA
jgi:pimeloyl-ACP methyl ester carboxylesterase